MMKKSKNVVKKLTTILFTLVAVFTIGLTTLNDAWDTTFSLEMSKTLDFNGHTLTIPENYRLKLLYYNTLDLKFINSSSRKTAKLNLLTDVGYTPIYT